MGFPRHEYWSGSPFPPPGTPILVFGQGSVWQLVRRGKALVLSFPSATAVPLGARYGHLGELWLGRSRVGWVHTQVHKYWSGLPFPPPGAPLLLPGTEPASPALARGFFATELPGKHPPQPYLRVYHLRKNSFVPYTR